MSTETAGALREILSDPALPVTALLEGISGHPGVDATRVTALREAHDYVVSRRLGRSADTLADVRRIDPELESTLRWHSALLSLLSGLPPSRARNAVLGDVHRGDLLTGADTVVSWSWDATGQLADGLLEVDQFPGLYDAIVLWHNENRSVFVVPTHRHGVRWEPLVPDPVSRASRWVVRVEQAYLHTDELIALDHDPFRHEPFDHPQQGVSR